MIKFFGTVIYGQTQRTVEEHYLMQQTAKATASTVFSLQNKIINGYTQLHTKEEEKEKPETQ